MSQETKVIEVREAPFTWAKTAEYSQVVRVGDFVYTAGIGGFDDAGSLVAGGFVEQARQTFRNIELALRSHGVGLESIVKMSVHVPNIEDYDLFKQVRPEFLQAPWPASIAISSGLLVEGMLIEMDAVAVADGKRVFVG